MHEDDITRWFAQQRVPDPSVFPIGIGDDMAQVRCGGDGSVLVTTDMLLDGTHFDLATCTLEEAAGKSMAASLSDCAAMATVPLCAVAAVALPAGADADDLKRIHAGLTAAARPFGCELIGGDITRWIAADGRLAINVTVLSRPSGWHPPVRRSGACVGDVICVTGPLGGSIRGRHLHFTPRVAEALAMTRAATVHAMMDITDGLVTDLNRICTQSRVGALLESARLPVSPAAAATDDPLGAVFYDGEDFELLLTVSAADCEKLQALTTVTVLPIGTITDTGRIRQRLTDGRVVDVPPGGFDHLR